MRRLHHFLILTFIAGCVDLLLVGRTPPPSPVETTTAAPAPVEVAAPVVRQNSMAEETATHTHVAELGHMEHDNTRRERTSSRTYDLRNELRTIKHEAWNNVISTNWAAFTRPCTKRRRLRRIIKRPARSATARAT